MITIVFEDKSEKSKRHQKVIIYGSHFVSLHLKIYESTQWNLANHYNETFLNAIQLTHWSVDDMVLILKA